MNDRRFLWQSGRRVLDRLAGFWSPTLSVKDPQIPHLPLGEPVCGHASISGAGALIVIAVAGMIGLASISDGPGHVTATGVKAAFNSVSISGNGSITATGTTTEEHFGSAVISGNGSMVAVGIKSPFVSVSISGNGALTTDGNKGIYITISISGNGVLTAVVRKDSRSLVTISSGGEMSSSGDKQSVGTALISGNGDLIASGSASEEAFGVLRRWTGSEWVPSTMKVYKDGAWQKKPLKRWSGSQWLQIDSDGE